MIWPTFEDETGTPLARGARVPAHGIASMTILDPRMRGEVHQRRVAVGVHGFLVEGPRRVAEAEVIEIPALMTNPTDE
jgi:hypothetical protein